MATTTISPKLQKQLEAIEAKAQAKAAKEQARVLLLAEKEKQQAIAAFESVDARDTIIDSQKVGRAALVAKHQKEFAEFDKACKEQIKEFEKTYGVPFQAKPKRKGKKYTKADAATKFEMALKVGYIYNAETNKIENTITGKVSDYDETKKGNIIFVNPAVKGQSVVVDKKVFVTAFKAKK